MDITSLGFDLSLEEYRQDNNLEDYEVGRVVLEHKDRYVISNAQNIWEAEVIGNLRYSADSRYDLPAVGDWVFYAEYDDAKALIHAILPRKSIIERKEVGRSSRIQIIATNVDFGLLVQAVDRDFNLNRLERYLTICYTAKVQPIIVLSKIDLIPLDKLNSLKALVLERTGLQAIGVCNIFQGYDEVEEILEKGKTYCLLGSSGVGKSTLLNHLIQSEHMKTGHISAHVNKGRHVTSHRELLVIKNGAILIDNPGMREVGVSSVTEGLEMAFKEIINLAENCKYKDCQHIQEKGCAVLNSLDNGEISEEAYNNFQKLQREKAYFETSALEKKKKEKSFGKMIKNVLQEKRKTKF